MCEIVVIAAVLAIAIQVRCGELFNAREVNTRITQQLRQDDSCLRQRIGGADLGSDKGLSILRSREHQGQAAEKNNTNCR